jgi:hypothetical protein
MQKVILHNEAISLFPLFANVIFVCLSVTWRLSLKRWDMTLQFAPVSSNARMCTGGSLGFLLDIATS